MTITHKTPADSSFSAAGKTAWDQEHTLPDASEIPFVQSGSGAQEETVSTALQRFLWAIQFATFANALTASVSKRLRINSAVTISANTTIASTIEVAVENGGSFAVASGVTLTIEGKLNAGPYQIFSGLGTVKIGYGSVPHVYAEWWGAKADVTAYTAGNGTDSSAAIQAAIDSYSVNSGGGGTAAESALGIVQLLPGKYRATGIILRDNVLVQGCGMDVTQIFGNNAIGNVFACPGEAFPRLAQMTIRNSDGAGRVGVGLNLTSGNTADLYVDRVNFLFLANDIKVTATLTHAAFSRCRFSYNAAASFLLDTGAVINSILFDACRFEQSDTHAYESNATGAHGGVTFRDCVIEALDGQYAVDLGSNARSYRFNGCHFEDNGGGVADGNDVLIGAGSRAITFTGCVFSAPRTGSTSFYSVRADNTRDIVFENCYPGSTSSAYAGMFIRTGGAHRPDTVFIGNGYTKTQANLNLGVGGQPIALGDRFAFNTGYAAALIQKEVTTTDATATNIWQWEFMNTDLGTFRVYSFRAWIVGVSDDGAQYARYGKEITVTQTTTGTPVSVGTTDLATDVESNAGLTAAFVASADNSGTLYLRVTGLAATTIKWFAEIQMLYVRA